MDRRSLHQLGLAGKLKKPIATNSRGRWASVQGSVAPQSESTSQSHRARHQHDFKSRKPHSIRTGARGKPGVPAPVTDLWPAMTRRRGTWVH